MANTIDTLIGNDFLNGARKRASEVILARVKLPDGIVDENDMEIINTAYANLEITYRLQRAKIYEDLAHLNIQNNITARFRFYACYELLMVLHRIEGEKNLESLYSNKDKSDDQAALSQTLKDTIKSKLQELIKNAEGAVSADIQDVDAYITIFLTPGEPHLIGEKLSKLQAETAPFIASAMPESKSPSKPGSGKRLALVTDLFRDIDDWLTLLHAVSYGEHDEIVIITSNEVEGECAQKMLSYVSHLKSLFRALHNREISIEVYQGLPAFDFSPFHPDHQDKYPGVHYPPKAYSAHMRIPSGVKEEPLPEGEKRPLPKTYVDLHADMLKWDKKHLDVVNIAKSADLDMVLLLLKSQNVALDKVVMLGAQQDKVGTNTNGDPFHLQNLPQGLINLDSSYGALIAFYFDKKDFSEDSDGTEPSDFQFARAYLNKYMGLLNELADSPMLGMEQKNSIKMITDSTLQHIKNMQYQRGNSYDLFALIPLFFSERFTFELHEIAYGLNKDKNTSSVSEYLERAKCILLATFAKIELIKAIPVLYLDSQEVTRQFEGELKEKLEALFQNMPKESQAAAPTPGNSSVTPPIKSLKVAYPDKPHLQANFVNYLLELLNPLLQKADAQNKLNIDELIEKYPESKHYGLRTSPAIARKKTTTGLDEGMRIARSFLILGALVDKSLSHEQAAELIAGGFPNERDGKFEPIDISGTDKKKQCIENMRVLRDMLQTLDLNKIIRGYIAHDLGKTFGLIAEYFLTTKNLDPAGHDVILEMHLEQNSDLKEIFDNSELRVFIDFLDLLGHTPAQIFDPKLKLLYTCANVYKQNNDLKDKVNQGNPLEFETRRSINITFRDKTKDLELTQNINIDSIDVKKPYTQLPPDTQKKLAFLMWTGGLRIPTPGEVLTEFTQAWEDPSNAQVIEEMTALLMQNLEQGPNYCMLYNVTGLLHKTEPGTVKAFIGPVEKGGMGGSLSEVIKVAFPLILKCCRGQPVFKQSNPEEPLLLRKEDSKVGYNAFQVLQMIEMLQNIRPGLAELTTGQNKHPVVDFGSVDANQLFAEALATSRLQAQEKKSESPDPEKPKEAAKPQNLKDKTAGVN